MVTLVLQSESFACSFWGKNSIWGLCLLFLIWLKDSYQLPHMVPREVALRGSLGCCHLHLCHVQCPGLCCSPCNAHSVRWVSAGKDVAFPHLL